MSRRISHTKKLKQQTSTRIIMCMTQSFLQMENALRKKKTAITANDHIIDNTVTDDNTYDAVWSDAITHELSANMLWCMLMGKYKRGTKQKKN